MVSKKYLAMFLSMPDAFRKITISDNQIVVVNFVRDFGVAVTSRDLSDAKEISISSASIQLNRLYELGYLNRIEAVAESGGKIYRYSYALDI
jgi:predicted transcriptional regulator